jgi:hypothetical protein
MLLFALDCANDTIAWFGSVAPHELSKRHRGLAVDEHDRGGRFVASEVVVAVVNR